MIRKITYLLLFIGINYSTQAESLPDGYKIKKFMIRNASYSSDIAQSFNINLKLLKQHNKKLPAVLYKGSVINVPIKLKPVEWDPERYNPNKPFLGPEDARPQSDFEWDTEKINPLFVEEILSLDDIYADSVQFEKIEKHIGNIDNKINAISHINDSIKKSEFSFEYDEKDMNTVLKRMEKARDVYYSKTPYAREIDSLQEIRSKLAEETNRLRRKLSDYEYMVENAYYFNKFKEGKENLSRSRGNSPEDKLVYESKYLMDKNKQSNTTNNTETQAYIPAEVLVYEDKNKSTPTATSSNGEEKKKDAAVDVKEEVKATLTETQKNATVETVVSNEINNEKKTNTQAAVIDKKAEETVTVKANEAPKESTPIIKNEVVANKPTAEKIQENTPVTVNETVANTPQAEKPQENTSITKSETVSNTPTAEKPKESSPITKNEIVANTTKSQKSKESTPVTKNETVANTPPTEDTQESTSASTKETAEKTQKTTKPAKAESKTKDTKSTNEVAVDHTVTNQVETKVEEAEPTFESLSMLEQNPSTEIAAQKAAAPILYAKKIVLQNELNLDKVDLMIMNNEIKIAPSEISPFKPKIIKGVPAYKTVIDSLSKNKSLAYLNRFKSNLLLNDNKQAIKDLEKALDLDPTNYKAWVYHADLLIIADVPTDALKEYQIATELNPKNSPLFYKIARLYEASNNFAQTYEFYTLAIEADSFFANAYMARASLSLKLNDKKAALEDYNALINLLPNLPEPHKERGNIRLDRRDYGGALVDYNEFLEVADPDAEVLYRRGICKVYLGKIVEGCVDFSIASNMGYKEADRANKKYCQ